MQKPGVLSQRKDLIHNLELSESPAEGAHLSASLNEAKDGLVVSYAKISTDVKE
jgi:hypothetical protein